MKNGKNWITNIHINGSAMKSANNLKELSMDNSMFFDYHNEVDSRSEKDADDTVVSKALLFYKCSSKILERVSLRNSRFSF